MGVKIVTSGQTVKSSFPEIVWPAIPSPVGATLLACLHQLEQSQWWTPEKLREAQFRQLNLRDRPVLPGAADLVGPR
jgi:hypothetical protein